VRLTTRLFVQLGIGPSSSKSTPQAVAGLYAANSAVDMVASGTVRLFANDVWRLLF
jgi:hypothetical protein